MGTLLGVTNAVPIPKIHLRLSSLAQMSLMMGGKGGRSPDITRVLAVTTTLGASTRVVPPVIAEGILTETPCDLAVEHGLFCMVTVRRNRTRDPLLRSGTAISFMVFFFIIARMNTIAIST